MRNQYYTEEYRMMMNYMYENINKEGLTLYEKIYFTRVPFIQKNGYEKEHGELTIQKTFGKMGIRYYPLKL